jgi:hypothetical protein
MMVETPDFAQEITAESLELDGSRLQSFAKVYVEFEKIRDIYLPQLKKAQTAQEINDIEKQARVRIDQALKKEGLTPESYSQIINKLNTDTELRAKAMRLIDEQRKNSWFSGWQLRRAHACAPRRVRQAQARNPEMLTPSSKKAIRQLPLRRAEKASTRHLKDKLVAECGAITD